jgi:hypothetical protein
VGQAKNIHRLEYVRFGENVLFAKTAIRHQNVPIPIYDLANEVGICELGEQIRLFMEGKADAIGLDEFRKTHDSFHEQYRTLGSSHGMGSGVPCSGSSPRMDEKSISNCSAS